MVVLWYLLVLAPIAALAWFWWSYRRKQAERERESGERWSRMLSGTDAAAPSEQQPATAITSSTAASAVAKSPVAALQYRGRDRLLDPAETLLFFLLRTELPECEVLVRVGLDRLLLLPEGIPATERERRLAALARHVADFVVCDKSMRPLAAIDLLAAEAPPVLTAAPDFRVQCLAQSGIRHLQFARTALPKRQDLRAQVLGPA